MTQNPPEHPISRRWPVFAYGFRPFFLLAGLWALVPMLTVAGALQFGIWPAGPVPLLSWHGHEMVFGFAGAAIAGFLLTAVPGWTGTRAVSGLPLAVLVALWASARLLSSPLLTPDSLPEQLLAIAFLPVLAVTVAIPLIGSGNARNLPFLVLLAMLWLAEIMWQAPRFGWSGPGPIDALRLAINTTVLLIALVGGRIVPAFTRNALTALGRSVSIKATPRLDAAALIATAAVLVGDLFAKDTPATGMLAGLAAVLLGWRARGWASWQTLEHPLLWVLHLGYLWLIAGLALKSAWLIGGFVWAAHWMHGLTIGAFGTMILAVTTRAALGHTGRPLQAPQSIAVSYLLVSLAAVLRILGPWLVPQHFVNVLTLAVIAWCTAYAIFLFVFLPILLGQRPDGRPG